MAAPGLGETSPQKLLPNGCRRILRAINSKSILSHLIKLPAIRGKVRQVNRQANITQLPAVLTTREAAQLINRKPQTLFKWSSQENGPIRPIRINGRLAWRVDDLRALLEGGDTRPIAA